MAMARGGQTLLSAAARQALEGAALDPAVQMRSHGHYRLKGIDEPVEVFELGTVPHCSFTPPADADKSYRVVHSGDLWQPVRAIPRHLPAERDAFVGRGADLQAIARHFDTGARLVTLLGPGGTGKTRLAVRYGHAWLGDWPGGVWFCDLSEASTLDGIHYAAGSALGVRLGAGDAAAQLAEAIAGRGRCLVVLDNFEQVAQHAAATVGRWLDGAPEAAFMVTSRERLNLAGEVVQPVEPLPLDGPAIELFVVRARAQRPDFVLDDAQRAVVAEVTSLLDGLPLAIELAAARIAVLSPAQLLLRLRDRFKLLAGRGGTGRQATLRAAIDWSWQLLTAWEQSAFEQCSVFEGGFTLAAAEAVVDLAPWPDAPPVIDAVQALVDKSLLRRWVRCRPCRPPRSSRSRTSACTSASTNTRPRSGAGMAPMPTHAAAAPRPLLRRLRQRRRDRGARHPRRHAAPARAAARARQPGRCLPTRGGASRWRGRGRVLSRGLGGAGAAGAVRHRGDARQRGRGNRRAGCPARRNGPGQPCRGADASRRHRRAGGRGSSRRWIACAPSASAGWKGASSAGSATSASGTGRLDEAQAHYAAALDCFREVGSRLLEARMLGNLAIARHEQGRPAEALAHYEAALSIEREIGSQRDEAITLCNLADLLGGQGRTEPARATFAAALALLRELGDRDTEAVTLHADGRVRAWPGPGRRSAGDAAGGAGADARDRQPARRRHSRCAASARRCWSRATHEGAREAFEQVLAIAARGAEPPHRGARYRWAWPPLALREGRTGEAAARLAEAEATLRDIDDRPLLADLLCTRGLVELTRLDRVAAQAALAEAQQIAAKLYAGAGSGLGRRIERLRHALAD